MGRPWYEIMWHTRKEHHLSRRAGRQSCDSYETSHLPLSGPVSTSMEESHKLYQLWFNGSENLVPLEGLFKTHSQVPHPKILRPQISDAATESTVIMNNTPMLLQWEPRVCLLDKNPSYSKIWSIYKSSRLIHYWSLCSERWLTKKKVNKGWQIFSLRKQSSSTWII